MKKHRFTAIIITAALLTLALVLAGCSGGGAEKDEGYKIEEGWTIKDDGSAYTYAAVIENTTEDKILQRTTVSVDALDPDGNTIPKKGDFAGVYYAVGPIWPGNKGVCVVAFASTADPEWREWEEIPSAFNIKTNVVEQTPLDSSAADDLEKVSPDIDVLNAEAIYNDGESAQYNLTLKNNGKYDCEMDFSGGGDAAPALAAFFRNEDGEITGGVNAFIDKEGDTIVIPAGEEVNVTAFISDMPQGEPEFWISWQ